MNNRDETRALEREAAVIGRYLVGRPIDDLSVTLYVRAVAP